MYIHTLQWGEPISGWNCLRPPVSGLPATLPGARPFSYDAWGSESGSLRTESMARSFPAGFPAFPVSFLVQAKLAWPRGWSRPSPRQFWVAALISQPWRLFFGCHSYHSLYYRSWIHEVAWKLATGDLVWSKQFLPRFVCNYIPLAVFGFSSELCGW